MTYQRITGSLVAAVYYKMTHQDVASDLYVTDSHRGGKT